MRTLKKTLCLVLALVMVLGLCAFNVSAAEFTDAAKIEYKEAVGVMQAAGVLSGFEDGSFRPDETLTRAQAATMIACMMGFSGLKGKTEFTDCQGHWAEGAIAFCASEGIVSGYGDGTFGPNDTLTGSQWAVMVVGAMGYNHKAEGITGASWEIGVTKKIKELGLNANIANFDGTKAISRDQACELGFQAMQKPTKNYTPGITVNGVEIPGSYSADGISLLAGLKIVKDETAGQKDTFGRPIAYTWENNNIKTGDKTVYSAATPAAYTYTAAVSGAAANADAAVTAVNTALKLTGTTKELAAATGAKFVVNAADGSDFKVGDTVEVYLNADGKVSNVVVVRYAASVVTKIDAKTGAVTLDKGTPIAKLLSNGAPNPDYEAVKNFAVGDVLAVCKNASGILSAVKADTVEGKLSARDTAKHTVTMNGTKYTLVDGLTDPALSFEGTLYLSPNGTVISAVGKTTETVANYAFVKGAYAASESTTYGYTPKYYIQAVSMEGVETSYEVTKTEFDKLAQASGNAYALKSDVEGLYKVGALTGPDAGKYEFTDKVTAFANAFGLAATAKNVDGTYFTSDVKFIYVDGSLDTLKVTVRSGVQAVAENVKLSYVAKKVSETSSTTTTSVVFVHTAYETPVVTTSNVALVLGDDASTSAFNLTDKDGKAVTGYEKTVYIDGEKTTIYVGEAQNGAKADSKALADGFYAVAKNGDLAVLTKIDTTKTSNLVENASFVSYFAGGSLLSFGSKADMPIASDANVINLVKDSDAGLDDLTTSAKLYVVLSADAKTVTTIYITAV